MAKLQTITGTSETSELTFTKGYSNLVICGDFDFQNMGDEQISIWVERKDGTTDICRSVLLYDFILLGTNDEDTIQKGFDGNKEYMFIANIELTEDGGYIDLNENETFKIKMKGLDTGQIYVIYGLEGFQPSTNLRRYERKVIASNVTTQDYNVKGYDVLCLEREGTINEIDFKMDNGASVKMTPFEMSVVSQSIDAFQCFKQVSVRNDVNTASVKFDIPVESVPNRIVFPLVGVNQITIRKDIGSDVSLHFRIDQADYIQYGHYMEKN